MHGLGELTHLLQRKILNRIIIDLDVYQTREIYTKQKNSLYKVVSYKLEDRSQLLYIWI